MDRQGGHVRVQNEVAGVSGHDGAPGTGLALRDRGCGQGDPEQEQADPAGGGHRRTLGPAHACEIARKGWLVRGSAVEDGREDDAVALTLEQAHRLRRVVLTRHEHRQRAAAFGRKMLEFEVGDADPLGAERLEDPGQDPGRSGMCTRRRWSAPASS